MFKFFKRIRQQLLSENLPDRQAGKAGKYLIYALGEILLVVIGILIALQINNWNEGRLNRIAETQYLQRLRLDIQADTTGYNNYIDISGHKKAFLKSILNGSLKEIRFIKKHKSFDLFISRFPGQIIPQNNTYMDMISTGKLGLIRNEDLKVHIQNYYKLIGDRQQALNLNFSDWPKILSSMIPAEGNIADSYYYSSINFEFPKAEVQQLVTSLTANKETLRPSINGEMQFAILQVISYQMLLESANQLLIHLDSELQL